MNQLVGDAAVERLPASTTWLAFRLVPSASVIAFVWLALGPAAGEITAAALATVALLFAPRALLLDDQGFRRVSVFPSKTVPWRAVDSFEPGSAPTRLGSVWWVEYTKAGRKARWWYPAGWPAHGGLPPAFAARPGGPALNAIELSDLLNDRLAKARANISHGI